MQTVSDILQTKGNSVVSVDPNDSVLHALGVMAEHEVGAVLVIDNLQSGISFGAKLAHEVGAIHVVLSNFPGAMPATATVLDLFTQNAEALFTAVEPVE